MKDTQELIDECMDWFDFEKVHRTMTLLDWSWISVGVPDKGDIKSKARKYLKEAVNGLDANPDYPEYQISSGGIRATAHRATAETPLVLRLEFVVTEWEAYEDK